ncbi:hypothetical protein DFJ77DRAFT_277115 [Powellomyces hirtus]|nr:hypothetical protein DFJ77DRAFT_277115 [Powellomyces hirtus]
MSSDKKGSQQNHKTKLPWGIEKPKPGSIKKITDTKLQAFSVGINKKTPFQKQQEEAALRKKKEEDEAAKVYAEFVASFDNDSSKPKAWVKGGTMIPKAVYDEEDGERSEPAEKTLYKPQPFVKAGAPAFVKAGAPAFAKAEQPFQPPPSKPQMEIEDEHEPTVPKAQRKRNLDMFLQELKREQEERDHRLKSKHARLAGAGGDRAVDSGSLTLRAAFEENPGSHDTGDPETTNLYVGNINPAVDEDLICREFGQYGPIASVKIMWPRTQEEKERNRNCGFVSFMTRDAAAEALRNLDGKNLLGNVLRVGWGKAVMLPSQPFFVLPGAPSETQITGFPFNAQPARSQGGFGAIPPPSVLSKGSSAMTQTSLEVKVVCPTDQAITMCIHRLIERVIKYGPQFEAIVMERERENPMFAFLFHNDSPDHVYYRWKLYSILQGDKTDKWSTEPFQMFDDGAVWIPPEVPFNDELKEDYAFESSSESEHSDSDTERRARGARNHKGVLMRRHRQRFEHMLRKLTLDRTLIGKAMVLTLDHADAADEIISTLCKSLLIPSTPVFPTKIARLYLLSDILHNTSTRVPNVWKFRTGLEKRLEEIFAHLAVVRRSIGRRLRQEQMRRAVCEVLAVWEGWIVYPADFIETLRALFLNDNDADKADVAKAASLKQVHNENDSAMAQAGNVHSEQEFIASKWTTIGGSNHDNDEREEAKRGDVTFEDSINPGVGGIKFALGPNPPTSTTAIEHSEPRKHSTPGAIAETRVPDEADTTPPLSPHPPRHSAAHPEPIVPEDIDDDHENIFA